MSKKTFLYLFLLICSVSFFSSCKDDDNNHENENPDLAAVIAGTYKGDLAVTLDGIDLGSSTQFISISRENTNVTKLELKDFIITIAGTPIKVGDITIMGIPVSDVNSTVALQETSTVIQHPGLGQLNVKVTGVVNGNKADLHIIVYAVNLRQNIDVTFSGEKTTEVTDDTDYAADIAAWYKRESFTITGDTVDSQHPNDGLSVIYQDVNTIAIEEFYLSFPGNPTTRIVPQIDSIVLVKGGNSMLIDTIRMMIPPRKNTNQDTAYMILSGNFQGKTLTLNMEVTTKDKKANYIFTGMKKQGGATLESMTLVGDVVTVQPEIATTKEGYKPFNVIFYVKEGTTDSQLNLVPTFTLADGATIFLNNTAYVPGTPVDFSKDQEFTVKAESGKTNNKYLVKHEVLNTNFDFSSGFEVWEMKNTTTDSTNMHQMYEEPINGWGTSNDGVRWIKLFEELYSQSAPYAVVKTNEGKSGKAARLETLNTTGQPGYEGFMPAVPVVTSGTVFSGIFSVNISNTLKSTKFGYPCFKKPVSFQGSYKYTPGNIYLECKEPINNADKVDTVTTKTDAPGINAVLYEVDSYGFDFLDGTNLLTSSKIVAKASLTDRSAKENYTDFNITFDFGTNKFDSTKKYKLAIVCSSSIDGDKFSGAPGSVLYVDELKINF